MNPILTLSLSLSVLTLGVAYFDLWLVAYIFQNGKARSGLVVPAMFSWLGEFIALAILLVWLIIAIAVPPAMIWARTGPATTIALLQLVPLALGCLSLILDLGRTK